MNVSRGLSLRYTLNMFLFTVSRHGPWRGVFRGRGILGPYSGGVDIVQYLRRGAIGPYSGGGDIGQYLRRGAIGPYLGEGTLGRI